MLHLDVGAVLKRSMLDRPSFLRRGRRPLQFLLLVMLVKLYLNLAEGLLNI